jgi:hypothetical protein
MRGAAMYDSKGVSRASGHPRIWSESQNLGNHPSLAGRQADFGGGWITAGRSVRSPRHAVIREEYLQNTFVLSPFTALNCIACQTMAGSSEVAVDEWLRNARGAIYEAGL